MGEQGKHHHHHHHHEELVQAVVIAGSFDHSFAPLTHDQPQCMLPLANRPMLSYTLDCLKMSGVQDVVIYCPCHVAVIRRFVKVHSGFWNDMAIGVIGNDECLSLGDALRDLDSKGLLRHHFILIYNGGTVANINLMPILQRHKEVCGQDKNTVMTLVLKKALPGHPCRTQDDEFIVTLDQKKKLLHHHKAQTKNIDFPVEIFLEHDSINVRFDLMEPGIAICSAAVPPLFSDNFDCQTMDEFIKGSLQDDLTDHTIYVYDICDESYAARVNNMLTYTTVNCNVLQRWLYPLTPDLGGGIPYTYTMHNVYKAPDLVLKRGCILEEDVIVGPGSKLGEGTIVSKCSIGAGCVIGNNVLLRGCVVLDDVVIGDDCQVLQSVLASGVVLGSQVQVAERCVLGSGVRLADNVILEEGTRLLAAKDSDGFDSDECESRPDVASFGEGSVAFIYRAGADDSESELGSGHEGSAPGDLWGQYPAASDDGDSTSSEESDLSGFDEHQLPDIMLDEDAKYSVFFNEVLESLQRADAEGVNADNLSLEVNSSRHAYAVTPAQVILSVYTSIMNLVEEQEEEATPSHTDRLKRIKLKLNKFRQLLAKYVKSEAAQGDCLQAIANHAENDAAAWLPLVAKIIHYLYEEDILGENAILHWYAEIDGPLKDRMRPFIMWLQQEDSESSSSEEESEE